MLLGAAALMSDTLVPDRPGFSTGTYTVQPEKFNIELGYNYMESEETFPLIVLRTGITDKLEFDLMYDGVYVRRSNETNKIEWSSDLIVGMKYRLHESVLYNFTFMALTTLPVGDGRAVSSKNVVPLLALLWDYSISNEISLFGTLQGSTYYDNKRVFDLQPAMGISLAINEKFGCYIEHYSIIPLSSLPEKEHVIDGGITYLVGEDMQLDINAGLGLNSVSNDFVGFGVSFQFNSDGF